MSSVRYPCAAMLDLRRRSWRRGPDACAIEAGELHVWTTSVGRHADRLEQLRTALPPAERAMAKLIADATLSAAYTVRRCLLRDVIGRYGGNGAVADFAPRARGTEALMGEQLAIALHVKDALVICAVTRRGNVGVGLERIGQWPEALMERVAEAFLPPAELDLLQCVSATERPAVFYRLWAARKALFTALEDHWTGVTVKPGNAEDDCRGETRDTRMVPSWWIVEVSPEAEYTGAAAVRSRPESVSLWTWERDA